MDKRKLPARSPGFAMQSIWRNRTEFSAAYAVVGEARVPMPCCFVVQRSLPSHFRHEVRFCLEAVCGYRQRRGGGRRTQEPFAQTNLPSPWEWRCGILASATAKLQTSLPPTKIDLCAACDAIRIFAACSHCSLCKECAQSTARFCDGHVHHKTCWRHGSRQSRQEPRREASRIRCARCRSRCRMPCLRRWFPVYGFGEGLIEGAAAPPRDSCAASLCGEV
jgi:hypothetical protein